MYTNAGMLAMMKQSNITANFEELQCTLRMVEDGAIKMSDHAFADHKRWEQDMHDYFIRLAEQRGLTNVCSDAIRL